MYRVYVPGERARAFGDYPRAIAYARARARAVAQPVECLFCGSFRKTSYRVTPDGDVYVDGVLEHLGREGAPEAHHEEVR